MRYDKNRFKIHALPHPLVLHWVLNPVIMFNELFFGQRLPKVTLIDKESDKPRMERTYIPCPHCETLNDGRLWAKSWAKGRGGGHWFGIVCPSCHEIIPCLWNIFSLAILAITLPLWYFPARFFRQRWLEKEKERLAKVPLIQPKSINLLLSLLMGVFGAVPMWAIVEGTKVWYYGEEWDLKTMLESLPFYFLGGFVSGSIMYAASHQNEKKRLTSVLERHLIQAKSINWFFRGTFYFGGFMWMIMEVIPQVWKVFHGEEWDLRTMFDMLPFCLLVGFIWGAFMHVGMNLKGRKT